MERYLGLFEDGVEVGRAGGEDVAVGREATALHHQNHIAEPPGRTLLPKLFQHHVPVLQTLTHVTRGILQKQASVKLAYPPLSRSSGGFRGGRGAMAEGQMNSAQRARGGDENLYLPLSRSLPTDSPFRIISDSLPEVHRETSRVQGVS